MQIIQVDQEALALSRCYALLIRKAQEQRARLAAQAAVESGGADVIVRIEGESTEQVAAENKAFANNEAESIQSIQEIRRVVV